MLKEITNCKTEKINIYTVTKYAATVVASGLYFV